MKQFLRNWLFAPFIFVLYRILRSTWRVQLIEPPGMIHSRKKPLVLAHWHGDELALIWAARRYRIATITSQSKDGELMTRVLGWLGAKTSRGSSTRGGVGALIGLVKLVRNGRNCSFAVDGPKGPLHKVKPGIFELARLCEADIYVAGVVCSDPWVFKKAWNKAILPKPFSKLVIRWEKSQLNISKDTDPKSSALANTLEVELVQCHLKTRNFIAEQ